MTFPADVAATFRRGLLALATLTTFGLAIELAVERHWTEPTQLIAWVALIVTLAAVGLAYWRPTPGSLRIARYLSVGVMLSALLGIALHVHANYEAGPLDFRYTDTWDTLAETTRWWLALTKTVGPSPLLAPGALAQAGFCILLATYRHPSLERASSASV